MSVCGHKIIVTSGSLKGLIGHCTYSNGVFVRVTPVEGDPLQSWEFLIENVRELTADDCQCTDEHSFSLNQCDECPR